MGVVNGNNWWEKLKDSIRSFTTEYSHRLALDRAKMVKTLEDSLSWVEAGGFPRDSTS